MAVAGLIVKLLEASELETVKYLPPCIVEELNIVSELSLATLIQIKLGRGKLSAEHDSSIAFGLRTCKLLIMVTLVGGTGKEKKRQNKVYIIHQHITVHCKKTFLLEKRTFLE